MRVYNRIGLLCGSPVMGKESCKHGVRVFGAARSLNAYARFGGLRKSRAASLHSVRSAVPSVGGEEASRTSYSDSFHTHEEPANPEENGKATSSSSEGVAPSRPSFLAPIQLSMENMPKKRISRLFLPGVSITKASAAAPSTEPTGAADAQKSEEKKGVAADDADVPKVVLQEVEKRNKQLKVYLMNMQGSEFAKAGLHSGGVRTSFSVMNYQTIKQITGLQRVPPKLLVFCLSAPDRSFDWIDISAHPTASLHEYKESIQEMLLGMKMHQVMVEDSTQPMLLPQVTITKTIRAILLRYAVSTIPNRQTDSIQELTNRFTIFLSTDKIVTVHRAQCAFVDELRSDWHSFFEERTTTTPRNVLHHFVKESIHTFSSAISKCIVEFDRYEAGLFSSSRNRSHLAREIYHIKRRASVYGRTLTLTQDAYSQISSSLKVLPSHVDYQEVQHDLAHVQSLADELNANADSVLQLLFQLSSYQVNELMRVLTLFSAFFIPLNFIAAVYGMNFEGLPLLQNPNGEVYCGALMMTIAAIIFIWFKKKHFL